MATTIIKSIGSGGGRDYATIAAWVAAIPSNLVTADEQWIGELYNDSEFDLGGGAGVTINKTTDATRNIILRCAAGHSFKDNANKLTNALRYNPSNGVAVYNIGTAIFRINCDYVRIEGIQFKDTSATGGSGVTQGTTNAPNVLVKDCLFQSPNTTTGQGALILFNGTAVNCLAVVTGGGTGFISNGGSAKFINCLAFQFGAGSGFGFRGNYDSPLYRNCAAFGFNTNFRSGTSGSSNYNASGQASPPGANSLASLTASSQFENVSSSAAFDGRVKAGAALINAGVREQTYTSDLDVVGSARSTTTPTIGPWEYNAGGGDTTAPTLSSATVTSITSSGATIGATTDENNGTFYGVVTVSGTAPSSTQVENGQDSSGSAATHAGNVAVSSTGAKTLTATGLTASTSYYAHMMHKDSAGNKSTVISSTQFTTSGGGGDTTAPTLSAATITSITSTTAVLGATTDEANGTLYVVVSTSNTAPSAAQIIAGQIHTGSAATFAGNLAISSTGAKTITATGLASVANYYAHFTHRDAASNSSAVLSSGQFTTTDGIAPTLSGSITASAITQTAYTLTWPAASDNVGVTSYEYSLNAGTSYTTVGTALTTNITGRTAGTTDPVRVRAKDAAGNASTPLALDVTLLNYGVDLQTDTTTYTVKNNTGTVQTGTEFKLSFYRQDTDAFVVNKTVNTNGSGLLGIVRDAALANGVVYDIKITNTSNNHKGIFIATGGAV